MKVKVNATYFEGSGAIGKKGEVIEIPDDADDHSAATKRALATGGLVVMNLKPVTSKEAPQGADDEGGDGDQGKGNDDTPVDDMKYPALQKLAKSLDINSKGVKKPELVDLIKAAQTTE